jgi:hypothetical protein
VCIGIFGWVIDVYWYFWLGHWCVLVFLVGSLVCIGIFGWVIGVYWYLQQFLGYVVIPRLNCMGET